MSRAHMNRFLLLSAVATAATFGVTAPAHAADIPEMSYTQSAVLALKNGEWAKDVAVDDYGNTIILVTASGQSRVVKIAGDGIQTTVPVSGRGSAGSVAVDDEGNIFVTFGNYLSGNTVASGSVVQITPEGSSFQVVLGLRNPCDVAAQGVEIAVLDCGTGNEDSKVVRASVADGSTLQQIIGFVQPRGVAMDRAGNILVAEAKFDGNSSLIRVSSDGMRSDIELTGLSPLSVAADEEGTAIVAGITDTAARVIKLSSDGSQSVLPFRGLVYPTGVATNRTGSITVSFLLGSSTNSPSRVERIVPTPITDPTPDPTPNPAPGFGSNS
jgi:hypothetical protein